MWTRASYLCSELSIICVWKQQKQLSTTAKDKWIGGKWFEGPLSAFHTSTGKERTSIKLGGRGGGWNTESKTIENPRLHLWECEGLIDIRLRGESAGEKNVWEDVGKHFPTLDMAGNDQKPPRLRNTKGAIKRSASAAPSSPHPHTHTQTLVYLNKLWGPVSTR